MRAIPRLGNPAIILVLLLWTVDHRPSTAAQPQTLEHIELSADKSAFVLAESHAPFHPWGVNYDHNENTGGLIEDYWEKEWAVVVEDFAEIAALGANTVRIHLQLGKFMDTADQPNRANLARLAKLLRLAETSGLYLDITGLGCYHKHDVPEWYDNLSESRRWAVQARFWEAIARTCRHCPAVFCYDLMNEPIIGGKTDNSEWLTGELGGKHFVQRITLDLAGRTRNEVARTWVDTLIKAIRKHDDRHLVTVGVIPWALSFPKAKPIFYSEAVGKNLDFVSVHFYPRAGEVDKALAALAVYDIGRPVVIEETFPLKCSADELAEFIATASKDLADGWISFYWGRTADEYAGDEGLAPAIKKSWIERFPTLNPWPPAK